MFFFWKIIRFKVFITITSKKKVFDVSTFSVAKKKGLRDKLALSYDLLKEVFNSYKNGLGNRTNTKDILVFEHGRQMLIDGAYTDIYTQELVKQLSNSGADFEIVEPSNNGKHYNKPNAMRSYGDHYYISHLVKRALAPVYLSQDEKNIISEIEHELQHSFGIDVALMPLIIKSIRRFKTERDFYIKLLAKRKVKQVFLVVSYALEHLIEACKLSNIECIELQHGTMNKYHVGYSFPKNKSIPYMPDKLYLFGKFWYDSTPLPLSQENIVYYGFPHIANALNTIKKKQIAGNILVISQGTISKLLFKEAISLAESNPHLHIKVKLHPRECNNWQKNYEALHSASSKLNNLKVVYDNAANIHDLMSEAEFAVGVYSTAVYEAAALGCKIVLLNAHGIEFMEYLIEKKIAALANNAEDMQKIVTSFQFNKVSSDYFFSTAKNNT
jgi:hypothetical protein